MPVLKILKNGVWKPVSGTSDNKADVNHNHTVDNIIDLTATATELNYVNGVTSSIQTQLDSKAASEHTHLADKFTPESAKYNNGVTDLLAINIDGSYNGVHMYDGVIATEDATSLTNSPVSSGAFYAIRHIDYAPPHTIVTLKELYPVAGRVWTCMYNINTGWGGWVESYPNKAALPLTGGAMTGGITIPVNSHFSATNSDGEEGVYIYGSTEGGNIAIKPPASNTMGVNNWEIDAYNGNLRIYTNVTGGTNKFPFSMYAGADADPQVNLTARVCINSLSYGNTLPAAGTAGRIFFKKVSG